METKCYMVVELVGGTLDWLSAYKKKSEAEKWAEEFARIAKAELVDYNEDVVRWLTKDGKTEVILTQSWYNS